MDNAFISALVQAGACPQHSSRPQLSFASAFLSPKIPRRSLLDKLYSHARAFHASAATAYSYTARPNISRDEYRRLLDYYQEPYTTKASVVKRERTPSTFTLPPLEADEIDCRELGFQGWEYSIKKIGVEESTKSVETLEDTDTELDSHRSEMSSAISTLQEILRNKDALHEDLLDAYSALPFPGVAHIPDQTRRRFLNRLSVVEIRNQKSMMRFLSVIDDMKAADLPINEAEWNSAIAYTGRCFVRVTTVEVESALRIWKEMEQVAGVQGGKVTFNILFDIATKAGKFVLAEMILQEMANRQLPLNRFARTGLIYYHGLKGDGQGVRRAYRELVDAGHIIDTVVMDCVIASLLRAGEIPAAEQVYERMKQIYSRTTGARISLPHWKETRKLGRVLDRCALVFKEDPQRRHQLQNEQCLAPDLRTFTILIGHHISVTGELRRVTCLLDEMQTMGIPLQGKIFLWLFKGFAFHGGVRYTSWTKVRLDNVWQAFTCALDDAVPNVKVQKWMVVWVVRAFEKCHGRTKALEIWAEIKTIWRPDIAENDTVHRILREILHPSYY